MTTVVSNSAALVPAWSGSQRSSETLHHLLPFFSGLPCLVKIVHCPDGLRIHTVTSSVEGKINGLRYTFNTVHCSYLKREMLTAWGWKASWTWYPNIVDSLYELFQCLLLLSFSDVIYLFIYFKCCKNHRFNSNHLHCLVAMAEFSKPDNCTYSVKIKLKIQYLNG